MGQTASIKGEFTRQQLEQVLGEPEWGWDTVQGNECECGLAPGELPTAGWGTSRACCRIWIHSDGICLAPGLDVPCDRAYTQKTLNKLQEAFSNASTN